MIEIKKHKSLFISLMLCFLLVSVLVFQGVLGIKTYCGMGFTEHNWSCRCVGLKTLGKQSNEVTKIFCTGLNLSSNKKASGPFRQDVSNTTGNEKPNDRSDKPDQQPKTITDEITNTTIKDLTLAPTTDWTEAKFCGVSHKTHRSFKNTLAVQGETVGGICSFGYNYDELLGREAPIELSVRVYYNYDGGSRRAFYLRESGLNEILNKNNSQFIYAGAENFTAGNNHGLKLVFLDGDAGDGAPSFDVYLIEYSATTLISVSSEEGLENDVVRMFLTSLNE